MTEEQKNIIKSSLMAVIENFKTVGAIGKEVGPDGMKQFADEEEAFMEEVNEQFNNLDQMFADFGL